VLGSVSISFGVFFFCMGVIWSLMLDVSGPVFARSLRVRGTSTPKVMSSQLFSPSPSSSVTTFLLSSLFILGFKAILRVFRMFSILFCPMGVTLGRSLIPFAIAGPVCEIIFFYFSFCQFKVLQKDCLKKIKLCFLNYVPPSSISLFFLY